MKQSEIKLGSIIKQHLVANNMTQRDLAERSGLTESTISYYISNIRQPNITSLVKMAEAFNMTIDEFMCRPVPSNIILDKDCSLLIQSDDKFIHIAKYDNNLDIKHNLREPENTLKTYFTTDTLSKFYDFILQPLINLINTQLTDFELDVRDFHIIKESDIYHIFTMKDDHFFDFAITENTASFIIIRPHPQTSPECILKQNNTELFKIMNDLYTVTSIRAVEFLLPKFKED